MEWRKDGDKLVVCLKRGERIAATLNEFFERSGIKGGFVQGIGAVRDSEIAAYSVEEKKYVTRKSSQPMEIASLLGTISETGLHAHVVLSDHGMNCLAGHLVESTVYATAEIFVTEMRKLRRRDDAETGLKILEL